ncbi:MAG TPA: hypothetical protein VEH27_10935, partial [Methylomirabilota bacterium]|nr:hypothetical protein [Methylomirabilota bacterium]
IDAASSRKPADSALDGNRTEIAQCLNATIYLSVLILCASAVGLCSTRAVILGFSGFLIGLKAARSRKLTVFLFVSALGCATVALFQGEFRATNRWLTLGGVRVNVLLVLFAHSLGFLQKQAGSMRLICYGSLVGVLYLMKSVTVPLIFALSGWTKQPIKNSAKYALIASLGVGFVFAIHNSPNRRLRLKEYVSGTSYQSRQVSHVLGSLGFFKRSESVHVHLPGAYTDLALLHLARCHGVSAVILHAVLVCGAMKLTRRSNPVFTRVSACAWIAAIAVNIGAVPVVGVPIPFLGSGGSGWYAFGFLFGMSVNPCTDNEGNN